MTDVGSVVKDVGLTLTDDTGSAGTVGAAVGAGLEKGRVEVGGAAETGATGAGGVAAVTTAADDEVVAEVLTAVVVATAAPAVVVVAAAVAVVVAPKAAVRPLDAPIMAAAPPALAAVMAAAPALAVVAAAPAARDAIATPAPTAAVAADANKPPRLVTIELVPSPAASVDAGVAPLDSSLLPFFPVASFLSLLLGVLSFIAFLVDDEGRDLGLVTGAAEATSTGDSVVTLAFTLTAEPVATPLGVGASANVAASESSASVAISTYGRPGNVKTLKG